MVFNENDLLNSFANFSCLNDNFSCLGDYYCEASTEADEPNFTLVAGTTTAEQLSTPSNNRQTKHVNQYTTELDDTMKNLREKVGENHPDVIWANVMIGHASYQNDDFEEALKYYEQAIPNAANECEKGEKEEIKFADLIFSCGLAQVGTMDKKAASFSFSRSLKIYQSVLNKYEITVDNVDVINAQNCLDEGQIRALQIKRITVLKKIGNIDFCDGDMDAALVSYRKALDGAIDMQQKQMKTESRNTGDMMNLEGTSISMYREGLIHMAESLSNIAAVHARSDNLEKAIFCFNEALSIQMNALGEDDPTVAVTLDNIGTMNFRSGRFDVSLKAYKQVLKMRRKLLGADHPGVADALVHIGMTHRKKGEKDLCEYALTEGLRVKERYYGSNHMKIADFLLKLGNIYAKEDNQKDIVIAIRYFTKALSIYRIHNMNDDDYSVAHATKNIEFLKTRQEGYNGADWYLPFDDNICTFNSPVLSNNEFCQFFELCTGNDEQGADSMTRRDQQAKTSLAVFG